MANPNKAVKKLVDAGLFGQGLVPVATPDMVARYNNCLDRLGIAPTRLSSFRVDGMGWSPEIAEEKGETYYLSAGDANPMAVVVSPNQARKPIYYPYNSYDRAVMIKFFDRFRKEIADVTMSCCIGVDIDQELTRYTQPSDLLDVTDVIVRSDLGSLGRIAQKQRKLSQQFMNEEMGWFDKDLRGQIISLSKPHGDLRYRRIEIPDMLFKEVKCFHTKAFKGTFVFRGLAKGNSLLVLEDKSVPVNRPGVTYLDDREALVEALIEAGLAEVNLDWYAKNQGSLEQLRQYYIAELVCNSEPDIDFIQSGPGKIKSILSAINLPDAFSELERLIKRFEKGQKLKFSKLPFELTVLMLRPRQRLAQTTAQVVELLLARLNSMDVLRLYTLDKNSFFKQYEGWTRSKQDWVVSYIAQRYKPVMNQNQNKN